MSTPHAALEPARPARQLTVGITDRRPHAKIERLLIR